MIPHTDQPSEVLNSKSSERIAMEKLHEESQEQVARHLLLQLEKRRRRLATLRSGKFMVALPITAIATIFLLSERSDLFLVVNIHYVLVGIIALLAIQNMTLDAKLGALVNLLETDGFLPAAPPPERKTSPTPSANSDS